MASIAAHSGTPASSPEMATPPTSWPIEQDEYQTNGQRRSDRPYDRDLGGQADDQQETLRSDHESSWSTAGRSGSQPTAARGGRSDAMPGDAMTSIDVTDNR
jgi:hypothetical protein